MIATVETGPATPAKDADDRDVVADARGRNRLWQGTRTADFDDVVDAAPVSQIARGRAPS